MNLQSRLLIRGVLKHPLHSVLCIVGIALGIAVVLAIDITNESARRAFRISSEAVSGESAYSIQGGPRGIDESEYTKLRVEHGFRGLRPVVSGHVVVRDSRFMLLGIDPLSGPSGGYGAAANDTFALPLLTRGNAVMLLASTAKNLGVDTSSKLDARISGLRHTLDIVGTIEPADDLQHHGLRNVLITDISTAQLVLGMVGRLSRIEVVSGDPGRIQNVLPVSMTLVPSELRSRAMEQTTRAFHLNLTALSLLALIIGAFLIYNTMTLSVIRRRGLFALLRTLGMTRAQIFRGIVLEALLLAAVGLVCGLAAGVWLAGSLLQLVSGTVNDLYYSVDVQSVSVTAGSLLKATSLALFATVAAACLPALEAMRSTPAFGSVRSNIESRARKIHTPLAAAGATFWIAALLLLVFSGSSIVAGFASLFLIIMGFALITPAAMVRMLSLLSPLMDRCLGLPGRMATRGVRASLSRTQVAVIALAIAVSAVVGVSVMITSFRASVDHWLENFLRADVYIAQHVLHKASGIDPALVTRIGALPEVRSLSTGRWVDLQAEEGPLQLYVAELERSAFDSYQLVEGTSEKIWPTFSSGDAVIVSEPFAYHHRLEAGGTFTLPTANGARSFTVAGIFQDYGTDRGVVLMHRTTYDRHWDDPVISSFALYLQDGVEAEAFTDRLNREALIGQTLRVRSNRTIRDRSLEIFDRTFTITGVLRLLAMCIAAVGILSALTAIQLERATEFAVLRALGLSPPQLWGLVAAESGLMGLVAGILACPLGLVMAWVLIHVINLRSFGWSMELVFSPEPWITALALSVVAALAAGMYPAYRMASRVPASNLRYE